jgi:hypothetical protein
MPARDYSVPQPSLFLLRQKPEQPSRISIRRRIQIQQQTDLYAHLDTDPDHKLLQCSDVYELEDRSKPSVSSF